MHGFLMNHSNAMRNLIKEHIAAFEISWSKRGLHDTHWDAVHNYPTWGITYYFADLGNPDQLGYTHGIYPYFNFGIKNTQKIGLNFKLGGGLCYISQTFNRKDNYKNIIIGSPINVLISMQLALKAKINKQVALFSSINFTHFSAGAFTQPNLGMNIPSLGFGMYYNINENNFSKLTKPEKISNKYNQYVFISGGLKDLAFNDSKRYGVLTLGYELEKYISHASSIALDIDMFYNTANLYRMSTDSTSATVGETIQIGTMLNYQVHIGNLKILAGMGAYVYSKYKRDTDIYNRIGWRYEFPNGLNANVVLVSNLFRANFIEFGIGYKFYSK